MKTKMNVRYVSGREEQFEVELFGEASADIDDFVRNPTIVLQTEKELIIIPSTAIECISLPVPESVGSLIDSPTVRKGKRIT
jgi:hypothetical protein